MNLQLDIMTITGCSVDSKYDACKDVAKSSQKRTLTVFLVKGNLVFRHELVHKNKLSET